MTRSTALLCAALALAACSKGAGSSGASKAPQTDDEKTLYTLGTLLGGQVKTLGVTEAEVQMIKTGLEDAALGRKLQTEQSEWGPKIQAFAQKRQGAAADKNKADGKTFAENAAKEQGAEKTPSGLVFKVLTPGNGPQPKATDRVKVNYEGKLTDGTVFDSSYKRGEPVTFPLGGVIRCWTEGVQKMHVGETAQLVCPSDIAYGDQGRPQIPPGATLVFKVELLSVESPPAAQAVPMPATPPTPSAAPAKPAPAKKK